MQYQFEKFTNGRGEERIEVFTAGKLCRTTEETLSTPAAEKAKKIMSVAVVDISKKDDAIEDIIFEGSLDQPGAEDMYNQILNFIN